MKTRTARGTTGEQEALENLGALYMHLDFLSQFTLIIYIYI